MQDPHHIEAFHLDGLAFRSDMGDHNVIMDAYTDVGGQNRGPRPKPLLLTSLAGCTGIDVASLLNKMRVNFSDFSIDVRGELTEDHPKVYHTIYVKYKIRVDEADREKVEKAVKLSKEKYCGVSMMLGKTAEIHSEIYYL
jgi:putative redox protein